MAKTYLINIYLVVLTSVRLVLEAFDDVNYVIFTGQAFAKAGFARSQTPTLQRQCFNKSVWSTGRTSRCVINIHEKGLRRGRNRWDGIWDTGNMAAALENELEVDNEDYYSLLNVRREVRKRIRFLEEHNSSALSKLHRIKREACNFSSQVTL